MHSPTDLYERFLRIMETNLEGDEAVDPLCETDWIRILVTRKAGDPVCVQLEVELVLPACIIDALRADQPLGIPSCKTARTFVETTINHLEYLVRLEDIGLELSVAPKDGIWSASTTIDNTPPIPFFAELIPPVC